MQRLPQALDLGIVGIEAGEELVPAIDEGDLARLHHLELAVPGRVQSTAAGAFFSIS